jgi:glycine dehydrogenase
VVETGTLRSTPLASGQSLPGFLTAPDTFERRHVGPTADEQRAMLAALGLSSMDELVRQTVPASIRLERALDLGPLSAPRSESELLAELRALARKNEVLRSYIGMGYYGTHTPPVIQRNVLENPGWYTQYTPYQAEISQGRLEALLVYQTMVSDLTGLPLANASLLDEATAAAEAMHMCHAISGGGGQDQADRKAFLVSPRCHPQTIDVVRTRAEVLGWRVIVADPLTHDLRAQPVFGALVSYPCTDGELVDYAGLAERLHGERSLLVVATDLLALCLLRPPGEFGADVAVGSAQRFGVPMGYGGPHAAFLATRSEYKRDIPGRIIGLSRDARGGRALRMALQTREQHIRRDRATSNICTAQVLLSVMAGMYAVYHGPQGLRRIAEHVYGSTRLLARGLERAGHRLAAADTFDTLTLELSGRSAAQIHAAARQKGINLRPVDERRVGLSLDETVSLRDLADLLEVFGAGHSPGDLAGLAREVSLEPPAPFARKSAFLTHPTFHDYHSEHEMLRYLRRLEAKDLSLTTSMIPLGSCTMKLNATTEMFPVTWPEFGALHPFAPRDQARGYTELFQGLEAALRAITGFAAISLQPNAGSQGEYAGLLAIRAWHRSQGSAQRDVCLIPTSAHGTNPASAVMAGMRVVGVACDERGNVDLGDLREKAAASSARLAAIMVTYPSTHGVFEESIRELCAIVHKHGGQVYMDGANMNAQVGLCRPADMGADVCHLNLHKTFCIPHGGGGPGMGPIGVAAHLAPFLPGHGVVPMAGTGSGATGAVSAAPWGSASILPISWAYIGLMGAAGLKRATEVAILAANYMAARLAPHYPIVYRGERGRVAHEFILDLRPFEKSAGVVAEDVAKRLMDYGFHSPTMSFPVAGTLMIEPTESESKAELDRLCEALIAIRAEIQHVEAGRWPRDDHPLKHAPHTAAAVTASAWTHPYSREQAAFPAPWTMRHKYWPTVSRVDNGFGDRNLVCACPPVEAYAPPSVASEPRERSPSGRTR